MSAAILLPAPPCGAKGCDKPSSGADPSGVGYCYRHRGHALGPRTKGAAYDEWWAASSRAFTAGGEERAKWEDLEYGEWPGGGAA